jgi:hypothetical protein
MKPSFFPFAKSIFYRAKELYKKEKIKDQNTLEEIEQQSLEKKLQKDIHSLEDT